jgi:hypothetical protein
MDALDEDKLILSIPFNQSLASLGFRMYSGVKKN